MALCDGWARLRPNTIMVGQTPAVALAVALTACSPSAPDLYVDLKTDFAPGVEFEGVRVTLRDQHQSARRRTTTPADRSQHFIHGLRVAEFLGVKIGRHTIQVELVREDQSTLNSRLVVIEASGNTAITVLMTRDCLHVECNTDGAHPQTCEAGQCVDARCAVEAPEFCAEPECMDDGDCGGANSCTVASCVDNACLLAPRIDSCPPALWCNPDTGCELVPDGRFVCNVADHLPETFRACFGDANGDGFVDPADRGFITASFGVLVDNHLCQFDLNGDGAIDERDRDSILFASCEPLPNYMDGSGLNADGTGPDDRFSSPD